MDDSLATQAVLEQPSQGGQVGRANEQAQSGTVGQTSTPSVGQSAQENIQALQSKLDKQIAASQREAQQARQEAAAARQQAQQLQQRLQQMEDNSAPDDYARMELRVRRAEETAQQYAAAYQRTLDQQKQDADKQAVLTEIVSEYDLVSPKDLESANGTIEAMKLAARLQREREQNKQREAEERAERNAPDVGGGAPRTAETEWERQWNDAVQRRDSFAQTRLLRTRGKG